MRISTVKHLKSLLCASGGWQSVSSLARVFDRIVVEIHVVAVTHLCSTREDGHHKQMPKQDARNSDHSCERYVLAHLQVINCSTIADDI
jgi:hypothetical protein